MNSCPRCGKISGMHSSILAGCMCQFSTSVEQAPQPSNPLTDEELRELFKATNTAEPLAEGWAGLERFARAIEKKLGIGDKS